MTEQFRLKLFDDSDFVSLLFNISAYILHGTEISEIGRYSKGFKGSILGFGIGERTLVIHSFGTCPSMKQNLISLYNKSMHVSLHKISLGISSTPTDFPNFDRNTASLTSSLSIGLFNSLISMSVQFTYINVIYVVLMVLKSISNVR